MSHIIHKNQVGLGYTESQKSRNAQFIANLLNLFFLALIMSCFTQSPSMATSQVKKTTITIQIPSIFLKISKNPLIIQPNRRVNLSLWTNTCP